jgi:hypothetical protein
MNATFKRTSAGDAAYAALTEGIQELSTEAAGVLDLAIVRPIDVPALLISSLAGNADATRILQAISDAQKRIVTAPRRSPMLCASCPRPLLQNDYSFAVALPHCDAPVQALGMAVCLRCANEPELIAEKALSALRRVWPDLRPFTITHSGGHA